MSREIGCLRESSPKEYSTTLDVLLNDPDAQNHDLPAFGHQNIHKSATQGFVDHTFGVPTIEGTDGTIYLQGHVSNVPEISKGVTSVYELRAMAAGVAAGIQSAVIESINYLSKPNAVQDSLLAIGPALDNAVNYYANTPAEQIGQDANYMAAALADSVESSIGMPLTPEQRGKRAGSLIPVFMMDGLKEPILPEAAQQMKLSEMDDKELTALGIQRAEPELEQSELVVKSGAGGDWPVINERVSPDVVQQSEPFSCVSAVGEMLSDNGLTERDFLDRLPAPCDVRALAEVLGPPWIGKAVAPWSFDAVMSRGKPWGAGLREVSKQGKPCTKLSHAVVVDGFDQNGLVSIRDPAEGTRYEMTHDDFMEHWSFFSVFRP